METPMELLEAERARVRIAKAESAELTRTLRDAGVGHAEIHERLRTLWARADADVASLRARRAVVRKQVQAAKQFRLRLEKYGLTTEEYDALLQEQGHCCACCRGRFVGQRRPVIDHCHRTGRVRGLLCSPCNTICGTAGDDPEQLLACVRYLQTEVR